MSGCFSPFPHGTGSLSVMHEYLGLEGGPPNFRQDFTCPALLEDIGLHYAYGAITHVAQLSRRFRLSHQYRWPGPGSLAATTGVSVDVLSYGYLDVSVPRVRPMYLCIQYTVTGHYPCRVSPFGNLRVKACLTAHRSLSQFTASFIASLCLGIHRTPLLS